jgi:ribosomal protein S18 acetylase RimI-like enzyme
MNINQIPVKIRKATEKDIGCIKLIAAANKDAIGFVLRPALMEAIQRNELIVAVARNGRVLGFVNYHHRRDKQTTIYEICIKAKHRGLGIGSHLIQALVEESKALGKKKILLKCPETLQANQFYKKLKFENITKEDGKKRKLNIWQIDLTERS